MPVDIRNCRRCHKLFNNTGGGVCPDCIRELDVIFVNVREYLYDNPKASIEEMCEETGATRANIVGWLREGRLIVGSEGSGLLQCESCGMPIATGRYCTACTGEKQGQLAETARALDLAAKKSAERGMLHVEFKGRK